MISNPLNKIPDFGQSIWFDNISRGLIESGDLRRIIVEDSIKGVTSNPTIFEKSISSGEDYDNLIITALKENPEINIFDLYERLVTKDIQDGADILHSVYEETNGLDGYISVEVSPELADKTKETIDDAKRLWNLVNRPNLMIKVPATKAGIPAIKHLIAAGINVNVTLMFSLGHYEAVVDAYLSGLEERAEKGKPINKIASVASFFVSRVDTAVDKKLVEKGENELLGKIAVANSKIVYQRSLEIYHSDRFKELAKKGAKKQRLLWASTGTKNPEYSDVLYVEELLGADTVNTIPPATLDAFRDHGIPEEKLTKDIEKAANYLNQLKNLNINLDEITEQLQVDGVIAFAKSFNSILDVLPEKQKLISTRI